MLVWEDEYVVTVWDEHVVWEEYVLTKVLCSCGSICWTKGRTRVRGTRMA